MAGLLVGVGAALFGLACGGVVEFAQGATCDRDGMVEIVRAVLYALVANQSAYLLGVRKVAGPYQARPYRIEAADQHNNFGIE
jgi:hypothetical protein